MPLRSFTPRTREFAIDESNFVNLRGLNLADISLLSRQFQDEVGPIFQRLQAGGFSAKSDVDLADVGRTLLECCPAIVAAIIANACDEPEELQQAARLPVPTQLEMLEAIGVLTFEGQGGAKKVLQTVTRMLVGAQGLMKPTTR